MKYERVVISIGVLLVCVALIGIAIIQKRKWGEVEVPECINVKFENDE